MKDALFARLTWLMAPVQWGDLARAKARLAIPAPLAHTLQSGNGSPGPRRLSAGGLRGGASTSGRGPSAS